MHVEVTKPYTSQYRDPICFDAGDAVQVERGDPEFPGWFWCRTAAGREGWVHRSFLAADTGGTVAVAAYSAKELTASEGEQGEAIHTLGGWACIRLANGEEGWIPESHLRVRETSWNIQAVADPAAGGCNLVRQWLREYNWLANPEFMTKIGQAEHQARPLVLLAKQDGQVVGGLFAETQLAWLRISIMAVDPAWRSRGIGAALLAEALRLAVDGGCKHAYVDTMEYQAPRFYQAHGFEIVGRIPDWDSHGHAKLYLTKRLD
ncbi:GNAT family N-acetyltransferase [Luteolibacter sp. Populi]|uniref:GNAT family N-acetyltransferase n=1 Tax=Luteolibacter sp. Populi TaxID=3230487 RepID=UPI0034669340